MANRPRPTTLRRRRVGAALTRYREAAGMTADQAAEVLRCSRPKISAIENGHVGIRILDLERLLDAYGVTDEHLRAELVEMSRQSRQRNWWQEYSDLPHPYVKLIELESEATEIQSYEHTVIPGLLQTADYARAIIAASRPDHSPDEIDRKVEVRMQRQRLLDQPDAPRMWVVLDEAALHRLVGGAKVMRDQLLHLVHLVEDRRVRLQVLPFSAGGHEAVTGALMILKFANGDDPDLVYLEGLGGDLYLDQPDDLARCTVVFTHLCADALSQNDSLDLITARAQDLA